MSNIITQKSSYEVALMILTSEFCKEIEKRLNNYVNLFKEEVSKYRQNGVLFTEDGAEHLKHFWDYETDLPDLETSASVYLIYRSINELKGATLFPKKKKLESVFETERLKKERDVFSVEFIDTLIKTWNSLKLPSLEGVEENIKRKLYNELSYNEKEERTNNDEASIDNSTEKPLGKTYNKYELTSESNKKIEFLQKLTGKKVELVPLDSDLETNFKGLPPVVKHYLQRITDEEGKKAIIV